MDLGMIISVSGLVLSIVVLVIITQKKKEDNDSPVIVALENVLATRSQQDDQRNAERYDTMSRVLQNNMDTNNTLLQSVVSMNDTIKDMKQKQIETLNNSNIKGSLGNVMLEQLLIEIYGENTQGALWDLEYVMEGVGRPDAVVKFKDTLIPIDSKNLKDDYQKHLDGEVPLKHVTQAIGKSVKDISKYIRPDLKTSAHGILFLPSEQMYYDIFVSNATHSSVSVLRKECIKYNIVICSPGTLYIELGRIMEHIRTSAVSTEIRAQLEMLKNVDETYARVGSQLEAWETRIRNLGAENSTLLNIVRNSEKKIKTLHVPEE